MLRGGITGASADGDLGHKVGRLFLPRERCSMSMRRKIVGSDGDLPGGSDLTWNEVLDVGPSDRPNRVGAHATNPPTSQVGERKSGLTISSKLAAEKREERRVLIDGEKPAVALVPSPRDIADWPSDDLAEEGIEAS